MTDDRSLGREADDVTPDIGQAAFREIGIRAGRGLQDGGFEVNTDASLFYATFEDGAEYHERRYGLAIDHLKSSVRGRAYDNDVMRLRVGPGGYYAQSQNYPTAFFGDTGSAKATFVTDSEAAAIVWEAVAHYRAEEARTLFCVYSDDDVPDFFLGYRVSDDQRYEFGMLKRIVPLHMRVSFEAADDVPLLGAPSGTVIYQRTRAGKHVVVRSAGRRRPLMVGNGSH